MEISSLEQTAGQARAMRRYYRLQSKIYDATRWTFLFGRKRLIRQLASLLQSQHLEVLEVGCGTGYNLARMARCLPKARLTGVDVSADMLERAARRLSSVKERIGLHEQSYGIGQLPGEGTFDVIVFSYSLSMINPHWQTLLLRAHQDLKPGGLIAVVDFHDTPFSWFRRHMANNHVRMEAHLLPVLEKLCSPVDSKIYRAYAGVWQYGVFLGRKREE